jgi:hypothetical protein
MDIKDIKAGDILVVRYKPNPSLFWEYQRHHITFIASGGYNQSEFGKSYLSIPTIAKIDLIGEFSVDGSIGFAANKTFEHCESELFKPTMSQYVELMEAIAANGYTYNTKTKQLKKKENEIV